MNALDLLKQQHQEVKSLFEEIEQSDDPEEKAEFVQDLADNLAAHATIEEKIFYPAAYEDETKEDLEEAVEEHLSAKRILADLIEMGPEDENFDAKIMVLKEQIEHHVEDEEKKLFPKVQSILDSAMLETLGTQMEELFDQEMAEEPSEKIPDETLRAAPLKGKRTRPAQHR
jgi:hemerythrin superfamily protein